MNAPADPNRGIIAWVTRAAATRPWLFLLGAMVVTAVSVKLASHLELEKGGLIIRTAAHGARKSDMERELQYLFRLHEVLQERVESSLAPAMVFQEADLPVRVVRDVFSKEFDRAALCRARRRASRNRSWGGSTGARGLRPWRMPPWAARPFPR